MSHVTKLAERVSQPSLCAADLGLLLSPETWLGHSTPTEFLNVSGDDVPLVASRAEIEECFAERGISDRATRETLISLLLNADVQCMSHALSALLSLSDLEAAGLMPARVRNVLDQGAVVFDHIGVEVFGKLEWYIELFDRAYAPLEINVVKDRIFPSVQVRRALAYDPDLADVRIARIFFAHGDNEVNLEVFEATQSWKYIALRQAALYAHLGDPPGRTQAYLRLTDAGCAVLEPVGHVAFRVPDARIVENIQAVLLQERSRAAAATMRPYVENVFFNPSDGSTNTKFVVATPLPSGEYLDSQIIEVVSYDE